MRKKMQRFAVGIFAIALTAVSCTAKEKDPQEGYMIRLNTLFSGSEIDLCDSTVRSYLEAADEKEICALLTQYSGVSKDRQAVEIEWSGDILTEYSVYISEESDFTNAYSEKVYGTSWSSSALSPGKTYYYKVVAETGEESVTDTFKTKDLPVRYISVAGGVNVRDMGGWKTESGQKVAYGKIYRGGNFQKTTFLFGGGKKLLCDVLGVKSEVDFRTSGYDDGEQSTSIFGENCVYTKATISAYGHLFPQFKWENGTSRYNPTTVSGIQALFEHLSKEENYPVYIHCNAGADRTGTAAFFINGLLGVSFEDLTRDFELTSFSKSGRRWRSDIQNGTFTSDGVMEDDPTTNYVGWNKAYDLLMKYYGESGVLSNAIESYLTEHCLVPKAHLDAVKSIMLGN